jgi:hypothetical protein
MSGRSVLERLGQVFSQGLRKSIAQTGPVVHPRRSVATEDCNAR